MPKKILTDEEFIKLYESVGPTEAAKEIGIATRNIYERRRKIEASGTLIKTPERKVIVKEHVEYPHRLETELLNGTIVVFSDAHFWPGIRSTAFRALLWINEALKPNIIVNNGDAFDGATTSRHPPLGWTKPPTAKEELECVDDRLEEIRKSCKTAELIWCQGNHDARFDMRLADRVGEYKGVSGFKLSDHFPAWKFCISLWVNDSLVIKHRFKGGVHATHNNAVNSGKSVTTGHLHSLKVTPYSDYSNKGLPRYGTDTGTLADPYGP